MIEKGSDLFTLLLLLLLLLFLLARLRYSFIPLLHSLEFPPFFLFFSLICDLPDHAIIPSQTRSDVHTPYDTKRALTQVHSIRTVLYLTCTLHARTYIIRHKKGFPALVVVVSRT